VLVVLDLKDSRSHDLLGRTEELLNAGICEDKLLPVDAVFVDTNNLITHY
jgi:hypothetical protein